MAWARPRWLERWAGSDRHVRKWRARWEAAPLVESLYDRERPGRAPQIQLEVRCEIVRLACNRPDKLSAPFREVWTQQALADALRIETNIEISRSSVQRILNAEGLRPHRVRQWVHSSDPEFRPKVARICELYLNPPHGAVVLSIDEKPMQALERPANKHSLDGVVRREFEYARRGTRTLLGALNVHTGEVLGRVVEHRTGDALLAFMRDVAKRYPGKQVYVIWDNLNVHDDGPSKRWSCFNAKHANRFHFVHTPIHASWVNQIEVWFSILQRRGLRYGWFEHVGRLAFEVEAFIRYWNAHEKRPFRWRFSGSFEGARRVAA
jgi:transposase